MPPDTRSGAKRKRATTNEPKAKKKAKHTNASDHEVDEPVDGEGEEEDDPASEDETPNNSLHVRPDGPGTAPDSADEAGPDHPDVKAGIIPEWSRPLSPWSFAPVPPDKSKRMKEDTKAALDATNQTKQEWYFGFPPNMAARRKDYVAKGNYIMRNWKPRGSLESKRKELIALYREAGTDLKKRPFEHMLSGARVLMEKDTFTKSRSNFVMPYLGIGEPHELMEFLDTSGTLSMAHLRFIKPTRPGFINLKWAAAAVSSKTLLSYSMPERVEIRPSVYSHWPDPTGAPFATPCPTWKSRRVP